MAVQAYSAGGAGPWSAPFTGTTWPGDRELPLFFWSNPDSVYSMDMVGDRLKPVGRDTGNATGLLWDAESDSLYWTRGNTVYRKSVAETQPSVVVAENWTVSGLAMDRLARRLYYSVPNLQRISSVSLAGGEKASLPLTTIARDLAIDSALARICWVSLRNAVECSLLDGTNRTIVHLIGMWKEQKVGLIFRKILFSTNSQIF